jgi:hypothetical protein
MARDGDSTTDRAPFNAKGLVYLGARDFYAERVPGGWEAVVAKLGPDVAQFFEQQFLTGGWYDVMPILTISRAAAGLAETPWPRLARQNAVWLAERDLRGIYRLVVSIASVERIVERLPELSLRYFDFGDAAGKMVDEKTFEADRYGIPEPLVEWFSIVTSGFVPVALGIAGAKNVRVRTLGHDPDGEAHGIPLIRSRYHITWD